MKTIRPGRWARVRRYGRRVLLAASAVVTGVVPVHAQTSAPQAAESSITVYGGYRWGGSLTDANSGATLSVQDDTSYALAIDIGLAPQTQIQLFYSHQQTALSWGTFAPKTNNFGLSIDYYHIGGTYFVEEAGKGVYVMGGFGAASLRPDRGDLNSETYPSGNLGLGYMFPIGKHLGLRFEVRGYGIYIHNDSASWCGSGGGCVVAISGNAMYQGEALAGLSLRF